MNQKVPGFAILLLLGITSTVLLMSLALWQKMSFMVDLVKERETYYKNFYCAETILQVSVTTICENFDKIVESIGQQKKIFIFAVATEAGFLAHNMKADCTVSWHDQLKPHELIVRCSLYQSRRIVATLSCLLTKKPEGLDKENNEKYEPEQQSYFMVRNFTIGTLI